MRKVPTERGNLGQSVPEISHGEKNKSPTRDNPGFTRFSPSYPHKVPRKFHIIPLKNNSNFSFFRLRTKTAKLCPHGG